MSIVSAYVSAQAKKAALSSGVRIAPRAAATERAELRIVREALEGLVSPAVATALIFQALEQWGPTPPERLGEVRAFAYGPLDEAVRRRMREEEADQIRKRIDTLLALVPPSPRDDEPTQETGPGQRGGATPEILQGRLPVVVVATGTVLAARLTTSLGRDRMLAFPVSTESNLRRALVASGARLVVIDATSPSPIQNQALAAALEVARAGATFVVWGADTVAGAAITGTLADVGTASIAVGRVDGTAPLLDLLRARRQTTPPPVASDETTSPTDV